jgi:hypothetical protein
MEDLNKQIQDIKKKNVVKETGFFYGKILDTMKWIYWAWHGVFGCPERSLTAPYKVRYCRLCARMIFESEDAKKRFNDYMAGGGKVKIIDKIPGQENKGRDLIKDDPRSQGALSLRK